MQKLTKHGVRDLNGKLKAVTPAPPASPMAALKPAVDELRKRLRDTAEAAFFAGLDYARQHHITDAPGDDAGQAFDAWCEEKGLR